MLLLKRQRRLRSNKWSINLFRENNISASDFILPIFLTDGKNQKKLNLCQMCIGIALIT